jgi:hypothetical protein
LEDARGTKTLVTFRATGEVHQLWGTAILQIEHGVAKELPARLDEEFRSGKYPLAKRERGNLGDRIAGAHDRIRVPIPKSGEIAE